MLADAFIWVNPYFTLENRPFLTKISFFQKLKMAINKGLVISKEQKYPKIRVLNYPIFKFLRAFLGYS